MKTKQHIPGQSVLTQYRQPSPELPNGIFNWVVPFFRIPDTFVLNHASIDGFFFIRYLKVLRNICFAGCLITYPILFPINATGGNGGYELGLLTIGNIKDPNKMYAHLFVGWLFFGRSLSCDSLPAY